MPYTKRTLQEYRTPLAAAEVLDRAKQYFSRNHGIYSTFLEQEGPNYATFRGQGGEEVVIAASTADGATLVTGSSYLFDMQIARFFTSLPSVDAAVEKVLAPEPEVTA